MNRTEELYPTIQAKGTRLGYGLIKNHCMKICLGGFLNTKSNYLVKSVAFRLCMEHESTQLFEFAAERICVNVQL